MATARTTAGQTASEAAAAARRDARAALSAADRENPEKLAGDDLRTLAHRRGVSRSESEHMPDDKLRMQLRYITNRQYADESA